MRTTLTLLALSSGLTLAAAMPAFALSVTNNDESEHTLFIDRGVEEETIKIAPGATMDLTAKCGPRCGITAPRGFTRNAVPGDKISIADGDVRPTNQGS